MRFLLVAALVACALMGAAQAKSAPTEFITDVYVLVSERSPGALQTYRQTGEHAEALGEPQPAAGPSGVFAIQPLDRPDEFVGVTGLAIGVSSTTEGVRFRIPDAAAGSAGYGTPRAFEDIPDETFSDYGIRIHQRYRLWSQAGEYASAAAQSESVPFFEPAPELGTDVYRLKEPRMPLGVDLRVVVNDADERKCNLEAEFTLTEVRNRMPLPGVALNVGIPIAETSKVQTRLQLRYGDAAVQVLPLQPRGAALVVFHVRPAHEVAPQAADPNAGQVVFTGRVVSITGPKGGPDSFRAALLDAVVPADDIEVSSGGATPFRTLDWRALQQWSGEIVYGLPLDRPFGERLRALLEDNTEACALLSAPRVTSLVTDCVDCYPCGDRVEMNGRDGEDTEQEEAVHVRDLPIMGPLILASERVAHMGGRPAVIADFTHLPDEDDYPGIGFMFIARPPGDHGLYPVDMAFMQRAKVAEAKHRLFGKDTPAEFGNAYFEANYLAEKQDSAAFILEAAGEEDATLLVIVETEVTPPASRPELEGEELDLDEGVGEEGQEGVAAAQSPGAEQESEDGHAQGFEPGRGFLGEVVARLDEGTQRQSPGGVQPPERHEQEIAEQELPAQEPRGDPEELALGVVRAPFGGIAGVTGVERFESGHKPRQRDGGHAEHRQPREDGPVHAAPPGHAPGPPVHPRQRENHGDHEPGRELEPVYPTGAAPPEHAPIDAQPLGAVQRQRVGGHHQHDIRRGQGGCGHTPSA